MVKLTLKHLAASALIAPLLIGAPAALAHHNYVSHYDMKAPEKSIEGTVDSFWFVNPHIRIYIRVPNETSGEEEMWIVEGRSRNILAREGWSGTEIKKGDTISLAGKPAIQEKMRTHLLLAGGINIDGAEVNFGAQQRKVTDFQLGGEGAATSGSHLDKDAFGGDTRGDMGGPAIAGNMTAGENAEAAISNAAANASAGVSAATDAAKDAAGGSKWLLILGAIAALVLGGGLLMRGKKG